MWIFKSAFVIIAHKIKPRNVNRKPINLGVCFGISRIREKIKIEINNNREKDARVGSDECCKIFSRLIEIPIKIKPVSAADALADAL